MILRDHDNTAIATCIQVVWWVRCDYVFVERSRNQSVEKWKRSLTEHSNFSFCMKSYLYPRFFNSLFLLVIKYFTFIFIQVHLNVIVCNRYTYCYREYLYTPSVRGGFVQWSPFPQVHSHSHSGKN